MNELLGFPCKLRRFLQPPVQNQSTAPSTESVHSPQYRISPQPPVQNQSTALSTESVHSPQYRISPQPPVQNQSTALSTKSVFPSLAYIDRVSCHEDSEISASQPSISSVQSFDQLGRRWNIWDNSEEILFQPFLQEALVSCSGVVRDVHCLMLSFQQFLCRPRCRPPQKTLAFKNGFWRGCRGV